MEALGASYFLGATINLREHLSRRLAVKPDIAVTQLLAEIRELGYTGSANLLVRYLNKGRAHTDLLTIPDLRKQRDGRSTSGTPRCCRGGTRRCVLRRARPAGS